MLCPSQGLIAGDQVNFDHMDEVLCAKFLPYEITNFFFEINKNLVRRYFKAVQMVFFTLRIFPIDFSIYQ